MTDKIFSAIFLSCVSLALVSPVNAGPLGALLPKDANHFVLQEVHVNALGIVGLLFGDDPQNNLAWSGTFSDGQWTYGMSAPYRDGLLVMDYSGALDIQSDLITWAGTGSFTNPVGSLSWTEQGSYTDATVDGFWSSLFKVVAVVVASAVTLVVATAVFTLLETVLTGATVGTLGPPVAAASIGAIALSVVTAATLTANALKDPDGKVNSTSKITGAIASIEAMPPFPPEATPGLIRQEGRPISVESNSQIVGNYANEIVSVGGTVTVTAVTAPSSFLLVGSGLAGLGGIACRRRRRRLN